MKGSLCKIKFYINYFVISFQILLKLVGFLTVILFLIFFLWF
ncbi:hypothetical Protein psc1_00660 [Candidatus Phytoplasma solani]